MSNPAWALIRSTMGVHTLIKVAGAMARVPDALVQCIRDRELFGLVSLDDPKPVNQPSGYRRGDRLRITDGGFAGFDVVFERNLIEQKRVLVLLSFCGREVRVEAPVEQVKPAA